MLCYLWCAICGGPLDARRQEAYDPLPPADASTGRPDYTQLHNGRSRCLWLLDFANPQFKDEEDASRVDYAYSSRVLPEADVEVRLHTAFGKLVESRSLTDEQTPVAHTCQGVRQCERAMV